MFAKNHSYFIINNIKQKVLFVELIQQKYPN